MQRGCCLISYCTVSVTILRLFRRAHHALRFCKDPLPLACACLPAWCCLPALLPLCPFAAVLFTSCGEPAATASAGSADCIFEAAPLWPTAAVVSVEELSSSSNGRPPVAWRISPQLTIIILSCTDQGFKWQRLESAAARSIGIVTESH